MARLGANGPNITYTELDPTKYVVHVSSGSPFLLILAQSFHTDWKLCFTDGPGNCVPDEYHLMVNGVANAWYVMRTGNFTLTLTFSVQELLNIGEIISLIGLMVAFSVFLARFRKYRRVG